MTKQSYIPKSKLEAISLKLTESIGSTTSLAIHTVLFVGIFALHLFGVGFADILLILTTAVSLEAIYLAIFIQMTVNRNTQSLEEVEEDIDEIQEDVEGLEKDIDEIQEGVDEIAESDKIEVVPNLHTVRTLEQIKQDVQKLLDDIEQLKRQR
jgi:uncharacterized protein YoxC